MLTFALALEQIKLSGGYQSGQMGQTVNLLAMPSVVRIHHHPPPFERISTYAGTLFYCLLFPKYHGF